MSRFTVDSDQVRSSTIRVDAAADRIRGEVTTMQAELTALGGTWTGQAAGAFEGVLLEWGAAQRQVEDALVAIAQALRLAGDQYAETEMANARLFAF